MSIILGINAYHADSSACLLINGKLECAIEEERINRIKHWAGFPKESIECCFKNTGVQLKDITDIAINTNPYANLKRKIPFFISNYLLGKKKYEVLNRFKKRVLLKNYFLKTFEQFEKNNNLEFHQIEHHLSHISSAFYPSGYEKAIGLSIDGFGDFSSLAISECEGSKIKLKRKIFFPHSLGIFYESITQFLGFKNYGDEYKVMGLASYGTPKYFDEMIKVIFCRSSEIFSLNLDFFNHNKKNFEYKFDGKPKQPQIYSQRFIEIFGDNKDFTTTNITQKQKDLACSAQKVFEYFLTKILEENMKLNFSKKLTYAGGCALNSLANGKFLAKKMFDETYIPYAPGDSGGAIGAALYTFKNKYPERALRNLKNPFLGSNFTNNEMKKIIYKKDELSKFKIIYIDNEIQLCEKVANIIAESKIVGWFQNKMEYGARALGNRSILADPRNPSMKEIINKKIKRRESFRPFAPAILKEMKDDWFSGNEGRENLYMSAVENVIKNKRNLISAVVHVDGTGRVQTVSKDLNYRFYMLINCFSKISNVPILLNTSFNENEPIVLNPTEAIDCFLRTEMDCLVLNNYVILRE